MSRTRLYAVLVVLGAVLLHLPGHLSVRAPHAKQVLPEDGPALIRNTALTAGVGESVGGVLSRAVSDPAAAWEPAGEIVAETTYRPLGTSLHSVVRLAGGQNAHRLAGGVSLFLLALVAWLTFLLVLRSRGPPAAALVAGLLVAASPHLGAAVGWPARLSVIAAGLPAILALHAAVRDVGTPRAEAASGGLGSAFAAGLLAAAAGLTHELGYGAALAALALVATSGARVRTVVTRCCVVVGPAAVALIARAEMIATLAGARDPPLSPRPDLLDALAGVVATLVAPLLPAHVHLAAGPWTATTVARVAAALLLVGLAVGLWRRRSSAAARLGLAGVAALAPLCALAWSGGTPHAAWYAVVAWPPIACGVALAVEGAVRRGGAVRRPASVCAALLVASTVAATVRQAPVYRVRAPFMSTALRVDPGAAVPRAWQIGEQLLSADRHGARAAVEAAYDDANALAQELVTREGALTEAGAALSRDRAASVTVGTVLARYAALATSLRGDVEDVDAAPWAWRAERAALAGALLPGRWAGGWAGLARCQLAMGALTPGAAALARARSLTPDDTSLAVEHGRALVRLALTAEAVAVLEIALEGEVAAAEKRGEPPSRELMLVLADALSLDAAATGDLSQYRRARDLLDNLFERGDRETDLRQVAYDLYLAYGDALVTLDRPALARTSYTQAVGVSSPTSRAAEHLKWLDERLAKEMSDAEARLDRAQKEDPEDVANAFLALAIVTARSGRRAEAESMFASIERQQGGLNVPLRFARAVHLLATDPDRIDDAVAELRAVLQEEPEFAEARFELGKALVQRGNVGDLEEAAQAYLQAATDGADREWAVEAMELHFRILDVLQRR